MPDMTSLEKPAKPPVPQPPQVNGNGMTMASSYNFGHTSPEFRNSTSPGESPKIEESFATFEDSHFGTSNEIPAKPQVIFFHFLYQKILIFQPTVFNRKIYCNFI